MDRELNSSARSVRALSMVAAVARNRAAVLERIDAAARSKGRSDRPALLAVTKSVGPEVARALVAAGQSDLAENRAPEFGSKVAALADLESPPTWHFVGHIQRNKARRVLELAAVIHSVDSLALLDTLLRIAAEDRRACDVFLQVKLGDEENKGGLAPGELDDALDRIALGEFLRPVGLMTMAPLVEPARASAAATEVFEQLASLGLERADRPWTRGRALLSMGMTDDLEEAVAAGSDWLRIGRALFTGLPLDEHGEDERRRDHD